jgi:hypothetical protein
MASTSNFGRALGTGERKTFAISPSLCFSFRAESFSDDLSLGDRVGGSGSSAGEHGGSLVNREDIGISTGDGEGGSEAKVSWLKWSRIFDGC